MVTLMALMLSSSGLGIYWPWRFFSVNITCLLEPLHHPAGGLVLGHLLGENVVHLPESYPYLTNTLETFKLQNYCFFAQALKGVAYLEPW